MRYSEPTTIEDARKLLNYNPDTGVLIRKSDGKIYHLGLFVDKVDAAKAYDLAAQKYHGEFAYLNFPINTN